MKKEASDKEIEKLKKRVEKLESEKRVLQKEKKALGKKLSTAKAKADKYHGELKKKETPDSSMDKETYEFLMNVLDDISTDC